MIQEPYTNHRLTRQQALPNSRHHLRVHSKLPHVLCSGGENLRDAGRARVPLVLLHCPPEALPPAQRQQASQMAGLGVNELATARKIWALAGELQLLRVLDNDPMQQPVCIAPHVSRRDPGSLLLGISLANALAFQERCPDKINLHTMTLVSMGDFISSRGFALL